MELTDSAEQGSSEAIASQQRSRLRRLGMAMGSYLFTFAMVLMWWGFGFLDGIVVLQWSVFSICVNLIFLGLILNNINLRLRDPSLTVPQIVTSLIPSLFVMYHLDAGQARAIMMLLCVIPVLYGILGLDFRRLMIVMIWIVASYAALMGVLFWSRPDVLDGSMELMQFLMLILVGSQLALLGGYISTLRDHLRSRNEALQDALTRINELAARDPLTGIYNRRHLMTSLADVVAVDEQQRRCSVCMLDIDHFKALNDSFGHQAGDQALCAVADLIQNNVRASDVFGRYGGEEFLLILPDTGADGALSKAERLREQIARLVLPALPSAYRVSVSVGIAEHCPEESMDDTIKRADAALYQAKEAGRNQVCLAEA